MTHDERIEKMARAMHAADVEPRMFDPHWIVRGFDELNCIAKGWWHRMATAALAAAGVEEMVRAAFNAGWRERTIYDVTGHCKAEDAIVREVMSK